MKQWYTLGTDVMKEAREERGLSYEAMGRLLHVSGKTYERWEKRGQVPRSPTGTVQRLGVILGLEIEQEPLTRRTVAVDEVVTPSSELAEVREELRQVRAELAAVRETLPVVEDVLALARDLSAALQERAGTA